MALRILGLTAFYSSGLVILAALQLSSGEVYVRRGSDITDCSMKCPHADGVLELYRTCGGEETQLMELWCDTMWYYNRYQPRLLYNMSTGCWSLRDAGKNDSCVYNVVYNNGATSWKTLPVTVLGGVYVRRGSDITDCSMKCPRADGVLELYRICGGHETQLMELWCDTMWYYNRYQPRLLYNTSTGCWSLRDAGKNDSCVYNVVYNNGATSWKTLPVTVLDPVLISNITSNSSQKGEDIAVSVQFSGEETAVTWEVDGGLLPDRYRLTDDNRTVIIPRPQRDDTKKRFCVRITNPVSEEIREYQLEITADFPVVPVVVAVVVGVVVSVLLLSLIAFAVIFWYLRKKKRSEFRTEDLEMNGQGNHCPFLSHPRSQSCRS